jgi:hypothetical protein
VYPARRAFKIALAISLAGSCITRRGIERTPESADGARNRESRNGPSGLSPSSAPVLRWPSHQFAVPPIIQNFLRFCFLQLIDSMGERAATPLLWGSPPGGTPGGTLDQAPLSQEYFSVPDNYLGPKKPIGIRILPQCPIPEQFFHSPWRLWCHDF